MTITMITKVMTTTIADPPDVLAAIGNGTHLREIRSASFPRRKGYYFVDPKDSKDGAPVFNLIVPLRDTRGEGGG